MAPTPPPPFLSRWLLVVATIVLGLLPGMFFFAWVHPLVRSWIGEGVASPSVFSVLRNTAALVVFGMIHSATAQLPARRWIAARTGVRTVRAVYMILTGLVLAVIMVTWLPGRLHLWQLVEPTPTFWIVDFAVYMGLLHLASTALQGGRPAEFFGLRQLTDPAWAEEEENPSGERPLLRTGGAYGWVRHPGYALVIAGMLATPVMTLDRATVLVATLIYLSFGIPLEERKLVALFGKDYEAYRARVPALVPRPWK